jgi:hypothetical protein
MKFITLLCSVVLMAAFAAGCKSRKSDSSPAQKQNDENQLVKARSLLTIDNSRPRDFTLRYFPKDSKFGAEMKSSWFTLSTPSSGLSTLKDVGFGYKIEDHSLDDSRIILETVREYDSNGRFEDRQVTVIKDIVKINRIEADFCVSTWSADIRMDYCGLDRYREYAKTYQSLGKSYEVDLNMDYQDSTPEPLRYKRTCNVVVSFEYARQVSSHCPTTKRSFDLYFGILQSGKVDDLMIRIAPKWSKLVYRLEGGSLKFAGMKKAFETDLKKDSKAVVYEKLEPWRTDYLRLNKTLFPQDPFSVENICGSGCKDVEHPTVVPRYEIVKDSLYGN